MTDTEAVVGLFLRCRRVADMSQRDLAAELGVAPSTVARWETGQNDPGASTLVAIARLAGIRVGLVVDIPAASVPDEPESLQETSQHPASANPTGHDPSSVQNLPPPTPKQTPPNPPQGRPASGPDTTPPAPAGGFTLYDLLWGPQAARRRPGTTCLEGSPDSIARVLDPWPSDTLRSRDGRRLPAHLDVYFSRDHPPHRWDWWPPEREVCVPYRGARNRLRRRYPAWCAGTDEELTPQNTQTRRVRDMATRADLVRWRDDVREAQRLRPRPLTPEEEADMTCLCPDECWTEDYCVEGCRCGCEDVMGWANPAA